MSSSNQSTNKRGGARGGGGRGRGRGGGRRSGRGRGNRRSNNNNNSNDRSNTNHDSNSHEASHPSNHSKKAETTSNEESQSPAMPELRDEEVLIAFMPYLKGDNQEAMAIHERYQSSNDQQVFLADARGFLARDRNGTVKSAVNHSTTTPSKSTAEVPRSMHGPPGMFDPSMGTSAGGMAALERDMMGLMSDNDPVVAMPSIMGRSPSAMGGSAIGSIPATNGHSAAGSSIFSSSPSNSTPTQSRFFPQQTSISTPYANPSLGSSTIHTPTRPENSQPLHPSQSPFSALFPATPTSFNHQQKQIINNGPPGISSWASNPLASTPKETPAHNNRTNGASPKMNPLSPALRSGSAPPESPATVPDDIGKLPVKKEYQPKRLWTRLEEQPGKILANNVQAAIGTVLDLHPRQELKAQWALPLTYLRHHAAERGVQSNSPRALVDGLAVGLFRRGCTENGSQASIISKEILSPPGESRSDYPFQVTNDAIMGTVPFFSPRTPGHVVFRLYWQDDPLYTLATGPTLNVRVTYRDFESTIRFILSNFKSKKVNPTSLSSLNSLSLVLDQFYLSPSHQNQAQQVEGAGRAVWGCICEARKVLDACAADYEKTTKKLEKMEETVDELKAKVDAEEQEKGEAKSTDGEDSSKEEASEAVLAFREKQKTLMSGRASCERKWRDSQLAFASILKAVVTNPSMSVILRRELIAKLRLEYELWCPLTEEFAIPGEGNGKMWYEPLNRLPHTINENHVKMCTDARSQMQHKSLGFDPNTNPLEKVLFPSRNAPMNPSAVNVFNQLSAAMGQLYQENFATADHILRQREMIRRRLEALVGVCEGFPAGTSVAIFGSSANGFGSPKSDLDMCLQIPPGFSITDDEDPTGGIKMAKLARVLEENGMKDVDTARLTARIPVIKFYCPRPPQNGADENETLMECDLSMHNPLAVLNTSLLRTYAEINPVPRVLAGVIKRWAKARDINNPAKHTLSSYGYILMLLHFLTFHQRKGQGLVAPAPRDGSGPGKDDQGLPLLPNLQWMDGRWPEMPQGTPYTEHAALPKTLIKHPLEDRNPVNSYFYRPNAAMIQNLQRLFPGQDLSLGILLASFFRYYAYEFDYKRYVVSLHSTLAHGLVEREIKAELDGWRNYSAALTIEDPFETFYDVAHVLRGGYYHRIRREFAVAYSKIADVASGKTSSVYNNATVDLTKMAGMDLIDWICEPVATGDEATTT